MGYAPRAHERTLFRVQRLFSMFPPGWPGIGLLLLRFSVALSLLAEGIGHRQDLPVWLQASTLLLSLCLFAGYLTPIVAAIGLVIHGVIWWRLHVGAAIELVVSLDLIAIALLGPGSYSADAIQFGRRVIVLPPT
jgi:uncharacterized membrane protein YphA (DoxX/SURF4 family)